MNKQLRNFQPFVVYIQFHLLPCAQHAFALPVQRLRRRSCLPFVVFLTPFSCSLGPWSHRAALWKVLKMRNRRNCSWPFFGGVWKLWRNISVQSWALQNRSEPFWRSAKPFRTVLGTSALGKLSRKLGIGRHGQGWAIPDALVPTWKYNPSSPSRTPPLALYIYIYILKSIKSWSKKLSAAIYNIVCFFYG